MKKKDCLGIDKNGAWQVLESKYDDHAEDFSAGDELWILDNVSRVVKGIKFCVLTTIKNYLEWYDFE